MPRDRGVRLDERPELPGGHPVAAELAVRRDGGRAGALVDQRDLAEVVARAERAALLAALADLGLSGLDHEEPDAAVALARDLLAGRERPLLERVREQLEILLLEAREEGHAPEELGPGRHGPR